MKKIMKRTMFMLVLAATISVLTGCTNWERKYSGLNVEYQNLQGRYENCIASLDVSAAEKDKLSQAYDKTQQTIEELQNQIQLRQATADQVSGFTGMDVAVDVAAGTITVTLPNAILFTPGKASLKKTTIAELDHVLSVLNQRYSGKGIDVVGHTDADPVKKSKKYWQDNWELSAQRALSVLRYLQKKGAAADKLRAIAAGASRPIASNATASGKAKNRRVEVVVNMR